MRLKEFARDEVETVYMVDNLKYYYIIYLIHNVIIIDLILVEDILV
jgi:hypothetical protein